MTETENRCELCGDFMPQGEYKCPHCEHNNALIVNKLAPIQGEWNDDPLLDYAIEAIAGKIAQELIAANKVKVALDEQLAILKRQNETMKAVLQIIAYETARPFNPRHLATTALEELEK